MNSKFQKANYIRAKNGKASYYRAFNHTYCFNVRLIIGQQKKVLKEYDIPDTSLMGDGSYLVDDENIIIIWLPKKGCVEAMETFAHECIHAISHILEDKGIKYDSQNDEPIAYLMSWLFMVFGWVIWKK